ncbi:helix-turn-helix transcriptional regulator [Aneurinibacillus sp. BA2021]|nr:helix-turn-helix transcriptional regulator [Aneurinibacillus sp. BA2021]
MFNGERVREFRRQQNYTLKQLADKTGVSAGLLSQIERGLVDPTVGTFWKICTALHAPITNFFPESEKMYHVMRRENRESVELTESHIRYHFLHRMKQGKIEMLLVEIQPGELSERELVSHPGEEIGFVYQGELQVLFGEEVVHLREGDSIYFASTVPHRYMNPGTVPSFSIWAMTQ